MLPYVDEKEASQYLSSRNSQPAKREAANSAAEEAMFHFLPRKSKEMLGQIISERISFLRKSIAEINRQIEERQRLKETLNSDIDKKLCETRNVLYELESLGIKNGRKISLEELLAALHKERRHQDLSHWQDTIMLERELRNMEKELLSAQRDLWMVRFLSL